MANRTGTLVLNYDVSSIYDALNASSMTIDITDDYVAAAHEAAAGSAFMTLNMTTGANDHKIFRGAGQVHIDCCEGNTGGQKSLLANGNVEGMDVRFDIVHPSGLLPNGSTGVLAAGVSSCS
jgi:hypothetical protein